jgi:hypothetical protein
MMIVPDHDGTLFVQTAALDVGLPGRAYWYAVLPFQRLGFPGSPLRHSRRRR